MTRAEFDSWLEAHYVELGKVATARGGNRDVLHTAIVGMLQSEALPTVRLPTDNELRPGTVGVWTWAAAFIQGAISHTRRAEDRRESLDSEVKKVRLAGSLQGWKQPAPRAE
jgi:hypothetical protein